jgi:hypothetical protein
MFLNETRPHKSSTESASVTTPVDAALVAAIYIAATCAHGCASRSRAFAAQSAAQACAQSSAACDRSDSARASLEVATGCATIKSVETRTASAYGRTLFATRYGTNASASRYDCSRARLTPETRATPAILRGSQRRYGGRENHKANE